MSYFQLDVRKVTKSRKKYRCIWCNTSIELGDPSVSRSYVKDGSMVRDRWHPECWQATAKCDDDLLDGWFPGDYPRGSAIAFANMP